MSILNPLPSTPPTIILVRPQLGENIGMCARAMLNCAVTDLRIVAPRDGWPNPDATSAASGATELLEHARVFDTVVEAVADLNYIFATTARGRGLSKDIYNIDAAAQKIHQYNAQDQKSGILFGPERTGLENDDLVHANAILNIPLNPEFSSLNLAQAVLLVCHGWLSSNNPFSYGDIQQSYGDSVPAVKSDIDHFMTNLEKYLDDSGFFRSPEQRPTLLRNIQNIFFKMDNLSVQDVQILQGVIKSLAQSKSPLK